MKAGTLNTLVTIQAPATGQDAIGQPLAGWSTLAQVWASGSDDTGAARMPTHRRMTRPDDEFARRWMTAVMTRRDTRRKEYRS